MINRSLYIIATCLMFGLGAYTWKVSHTGYYASTDNSQLPPMNDKNINSGGMLVYVGETPITMEDIEWEFDLQTIALKTGKEEPGDAAESGDNRTANLAPLKEKILAQLIERKLLYKYISQDSQFDLTNPNRYVDCLVEWQDAIKASRELLQRALDQERLKSRLCETQILSQYATEVLFTKIAVSDDEILEYFNNHHNEFLVGEKATIRQVVLATETEALAIKKKLTRANHAELARKYSIAPEGANGGLIGPFTKQEMPRIFDIAFTMRPGEIRGVLKSSYGFHIIELEHLTPKFAQTLEGATGQIRSILTKKKQQEEYRKWVELALNVIPVRGPKPL